MTSPSNQYQLDFSSMQNSKLFHKFMKNKQGDGTITAVKQNTATAMHTRTNRQQQGTDNSLQNNNNDDNAANEQIYSGQKIKVSAPLSDEKTYQTNSSTGNGNGDKKKYMEVMSSYKKDHEYARNKEQQEQQKEHTDYQSAKGLVRKQLQGIAQKKHYHSVNEQVNDNFYQPDQNQNLHSDNSKRNFANIAKAQNKQQVYPTPKAKRQRNFNRNDYTNPQQQSSQHNKQDQSKNNQKQKDHNYHDNNDNNSMQSFKIKPTQQLQSQARPQTTKPSGQHQGQEQTSSSASYQIKYEKLHVKYEELKDHTQAQTKRMKREITEWEDQVELIREKLFAAQSREDSLIIENKRLKDKIDHEAQQRVAAQQETKQLEFQVQKLQDQLTMRQGSVKQRSDDSQHWKAEAEAINQEFAALRMSYEKITDQFSMINGQLQMTRKERDNKNMLLQDLRKNIDSLVEENGNAKDEIFNLTTKLYQMHQENQVLKADLKRERDSSNSSMMREKVHSTMHTMQPREEPSREIKAISRPSFDQRPQTNSSDFVPRQSLPTNERPNRRRGQFTRERNIQSKYERPQNERSETTMMNKNYEQVPVKGQKAVNQMSNNNGRGSKMSRLEEINQELEKIRDTKAINGKIRRRKIELEREFAEIEESLK